MSNNKQQTAVEIFWNQLPEILPFTVDTATAVKLEEAYQQAKEMEMQQNANTWNNAINAVEKDKWESFEQYYNETYNGNHIVEANKMMGEGK
jgi:hypothetical protein